MNRKKLKKRKTTKKRIVKARGGKIKVFFKKARKGENRIDKEFIIKQCKKENGRKMDGDWDISYEERQRRLREYHELRKAMKAPARKSPVEIKK